MDISRSPKNLWAMVSDPFDCGGIDSETRASSPCRIWPQYYRSNSVDITRGPPNIWVRWGPAPLRWGVAGWRPRNTTLPPTRVTMLNLVALGQTLRAKVPKIRLKLGPSRPDFQGHSRSSQVTRIDRLPVNSC